MTKINICLYIWTFGLNINSFPLCLLSNLCRHIYSVGSAFRSWLCMVSETSGEAMLILGRLQHMWGGTSSGRFSGFRGCEQHLSGPWVLHTPTLLPSKCRYSTGLPHRQQKENGPRNDYFPPLSYVDSRSHLEAYKFPFHQSNRSCQRSWW